MVKWLFRLSSLLLLLLLMLAGVLYWQLRASLAVLEGELSLSGLSAAVVIERDDLGVPTIQADNLLDATRALGFLHAQERFFQMDLLRRSAAAELSELFGIAALDYDQRIRLHRLRSRAESSFTRLSGTDQQLLHTYSAGVNAGLAALRQVPFEYLVLRIDPKPWQAVDTILVGLAMYLDLQDETAQYEATQATLYQHLPTPVAAFFTPPGTSWDAPLQGSAYEQPSVPTSEQFDLRTLTQQLALELTFTETIAQGSNNWAVSGAHTETGAALLANDMHLGLQVPNTWYRARIIYADHDLVGVTLPGVPMLVAGTNGHIAWGFTNAYGDWSDRIIISADKFRQIEQEIITIKDSDPVTLSIAETRWGPVLDESTALSWVGHHPRAVDLNLIHLAHSRDLATALDIANQSGVPGQNIVLADRQGNIAWTIAGPIPHRQGFTGQLPQVWNTNQTWQGWLSAAEYPRIINPSSGLIWTANARVVDGDDLAKIGDGGYALGARAQQIQESLQSLQKPMDTAAMLALQLDDQALFLQRWRDLLMATLSAEQRISPSRQALYQLVHDWSGKASIDAVGYRLVRAFREQVWALAFAPLQAYLQQFDRYFDYGQIKQSEGALWALLQTRPQHYLAATYATWDDLLLTAVDRVIGDMDAKALANYTWGARNRLQMSHPFGRLHPLLSWWLDMPATALPGGVHMPRVQGIRQGASQRMVVMPGFEEQGIFHMPGGQSGHPLSPFYRAGHADWVKGKATPLLPGATQYRLRLLP